MKTIETLDPKAFRGLITTIGELPSSFVESMSYYEMIAWLVDYIKKNVIPAVNNNAEAIKEIQKWLENLDLQDEVDNKLDEMAASGQLADIISQYLNSTAIFGYDTVASMKAAENLVAGSYAHTLGYYAKNDGGAGLYKIRNITNDDTVDEGSIIEITADPQNQLIAELIVEENTINVKQFGAKGDGTTDDTTKIQNALTFGQGKTVCINNGIYIISGSLSASGVRIKGNAIIKASSSFDGSQMLMPHNKVSIDGLMFNCNNYSICALGNSSDCTDIEINNCEFTGAKRNVDAGNFALNSCVYLTGKNIIMTNSKVYGNLSHGCRIFSKVANSTVNIDNCSFNNNGSISESNPVIAVGLVQYEGANGILYDKVTISNCYATGNANTGIAPHSCNNLTITNCVSNYNHEHGFCVMDGKNCTISNCIAVDNDRYGIRIQGDYTATNIYRGYKNCTVTGCYLKGCGFDIDENIDTVTITGNNIVDGTAAAVVDFNRGVQIGRTSSPFSKTTNINITGNSFIGYDKYTTIVSSIVLDNTCRFANTLDGKVIENYRLGTDPYLMNTCSNVKIGESNNILSNAENISQWTMVGGASVANGVITKGSNNFVAYTRSNLTKCPRFVSVMMKCEPEDEEQARLGIRFRNSSDVLVSGDYTAQNDYVKDGYYCRVWDLSQVTGLTKESVAKIEVMLYLGVETSSLKVDGIYCALSDEPPILANTL